MSAEPADIIDQAIGWHIRLADASEPVWADFVDWLEADPAHADAYDTVAAQDRMVGDARFPDAVPEPVAANDNPRRRWLWLTGSGVAAAVVAGLLVPAMLTTASAPYEVATRAGERRTVTLPDGTSIEMSGGTTLRLDRADPRVATLDAGEAVFHVRHDDAKPFALTSGEVTIRDLGTVFNVERNGAQVSVAVSEGSVLVQPHLDALTLKAGDALTLRSNGTGAVRSRVDPESVGGWRSNMIGFDSEPLDQVAATIERLYGTRIELDRGLSGRPFTGMVRFTGTADRDVPHLAELIGATWRRDKEKWILSDRPGASR